MSWTNRKVTGTVLGLMMGFLSAGRAVATEWTVTPLLELRWRQEVVNTLAASAAQDHAYSLGNLRERFGGNLKGGFLTLHVLGQLANSYNVPNDGSFGPGPNYYSYSNGHSAPTLAALEELSLTARAPIGASLTVGRIALKEGAEPASSDTRLDGLRESRIAERLIGTWDWTNLGRRYDGLSANYASESVSASGFAARILQGGFNYADGYRSLDRVEVAGLSLTARKGVLVPNTEVRLFNVAYRDRRAVTGSTLGERLYLDTVGADWVGVYPAGPGVTDLLLWGAYQFGDYGTAHQSAEAFLLEGGYGLPKVAGAPWLRAGVNYASGGSPTNTRTHTTFFNMAPTNHKFYGIQDLNAFQNLTDYFLQLIVKPHAAVSVEIQDHFFRLSNTRDGWFSGSGPASDRVFGYTNRRPGSGELSRNIGNELDLVTTWTVVKGLALQAGYSHFEGAAAARSIYPTKSVANYFYSQLSYKY